MKVIYMQDTIDLIEVRNGKEEALAIIAQGIVIPGVEDSDEKSYLLIEEEEDVRENTLQEGHEGQDQST
jgi:hypothetical protein